MSLSGDGGRSPRPRSYRLFGLLAVILILPLGCDPGGRDASKAPPARVPAAYQPERFPDLPLHLLSGYRFIEGEDQIAVSVAGGAVRRLRLGFISRESVPGEDPRRVLERLANALPADGWTAIPVDKSDLGISQRWGKPGEVLLVTAGRDGTTTTVRLLLVPADP